MKKLFYVVFIIAFVAVDLITKQVITTQIEVHEMVPVIDNFFWLTHYHNTGAAWSMFSNSTMLLTVVSLIAALVLLYILFAKNNTRFSSLALVCMASGCIGNLYDRFALGYVRDFLSFNIFGYMFPIFNIADSLLVIGVGMMFLEVLINETNYSQR